MKKRLTVMCAVILAAGMLCAQDGEAQPKKRRGRRPLDIAALGGYVTQVNTGKVIRVINAQNAVPKEVLESVVKDIRIGISLPVNLESGDSADVKSWFKEDTAAVVFVESSPGKPRILVAPEDAWGVLNTYPLTEDNPSPEVLALRARKELWRAAAMTLGASDSMYQPCLMQPVHSLKDIDGLIMESPSPEALNKMIANARKLGVMRRYTTTYRKACREGWAPPPTNDVQKAIWEQVKADKERGPTNPILILPPKQKK